MSSTQFNKGTSSYGLLAEVKNWLLSKYDPQKEAEFRSWVEGLTGLSISPDFQKVPRPNHSMQNWHQLENLSNFIKTMVSYGMNPVDLFEANDLFEVSLLALAGKAKTKELQSGVDTGIKYWRSRSGTSAAPREGWPVHPKAADGHQQMRQPVRNDCIWHEQAFL
uniref:Calponin-homology (CH) domain-containing protein n=1 Tax=Mandrillus leucophaeus TaxID=9568 RepID=A0A2K5YQQ7_MANLE